MDVLVRKSNKTVVRHWANGTKGRVAHPDKLRGALTLGAGTVRPLDLGEFLLVEAVENKPVLGANEVYGAPVCIVNDDLSVSVDWPVVPVPLPPTNQDLADALAFQSDVFKAFALVVLDEINLLRIEATLSPRTVKQLKTAIANKMG